MVYVWMFFIFFILFVASGNQRYFSNFFFLCLVDDCNSKLVHFSINPHIASIKDSLIYKRFTTSLLFSIIFCFLCHYNIDIKIALQAFIPLTKLYKCIGKPINPYKTTLLLLSMCPAWVSTVASIRMTLLLPGDIHMSEDTTKFLKDKQPSTWGRVSYVFVWPKNHYFVVFCVCICSF